MIVEHVDDEGDLNAFVGLGFNSRYGGLPSWVPNFSNKISSGLLANERERMGHLYYKYDASKQTKSRPSFGPKSLWLRGIAIDPVKSVWPMDYTGFWEAYEKLDLLKRQVFERAVGDPTSEEDKF
ncbi:hypothetical protein ACJZ2D_014342 [Fusarium nematophilum]